jgi:predicted  nucleic acid-binding Zn-ribbon protein
LNTLTKIFVVLQLVFALVLSVLVVMLTYKQNNYRGQVITSQLAQIAAGAQLTREETELTSEHNQRIESENQAAQQVASLGLQMAALQGQIADDASKMSQQDAQNSQQSNSITELTATVHSLQDIVTNQSDQIDDLRPRLLSYISQNAELNRQITELTNDRDAAQKQIETLQESIAGLNEELASAKTINPSSQGNPAASPELSSLIGTPTSVLVNGSVENVAIYNGRTYVSTSLGAKDGVVVGTRLTIYRNRTYIGDLVVQRVDATESMGVVTLQNTAETVRTNDMVISGPGM